MGKLIHCECGRVVSGATDDELIAEVRNHIDSDHPALVGKLSSQDILGMAEEGNPASERMAGGPTAPSRSS